MKPNPSTGRLLVLITMGLAMILAGCSSTTQLSRETVLQQNSAIAELERSLKTAEKNGVNYLAPEGFNAAVEKLQQAVESAQDQQNAEAARFTEQGAARLEQAKKDAATSRYVLEEVLAIRDRAMQSGASSLYPEESDKLEERLRESANLIEKNRLSQAKNLRAELINDYSKLELKALKEDTAQAARDALQRARQAEADKYAPKTLKLAEGKLRMSKSVLEADRRDRQQANNHAQEAIRLADKSIQITELLKDFDRREFTPEDTVLWYQEQLTTVNKPMEKALDFSQPNRKVVAGLQADIRALQASQTQLTMTAQERRTMQAREREMQQRFEFVQSLFADNEANVYRQRQNVLLSVHGFYFPSGQSRIESQNFALLNKIKKAIEKFPDAGLLISGHTDSRGDEKINLGLSEGRASNVAKFLIETGGIDEKRITVRGYGEKKPVASNENAAGRSLNRRVEVLITNN
jgi:outer membrane protein OmpA-like peptidoglycan-associated protein